MLSTPALIFDLDGTLINTAPDLLTATNEVLMQEGRRPVDPETLRHMVGFGARSLISQAMAATGAPAAEDDLSRLVEIFIAHYRDHIADASLPFPGVIETLTELKGQGARLAVLTNKPQGLTDILLPKLKMDVLFDAIYGAGRKAYGKPDARIFHDVVGDIGGPGAGAVMIGDSKTDVATARAAKAPVILVSYGYTPEPARELGGDAVIDDFSQIPKALRNLQA